MLITIRTNADDYRVDFTVDGKEYHTNTEGEGLWIGSDYTKQIDGTMQFNLRQKTRSGKRKAIARRFL